MPKQFRWLLLALVLVMALAFTAPAAEKTLRIGVASMITPVDTVKYYQDIVDYLSRSLEMPIELVNRKTYAEMDELLAQGKVDVAFLCSAPYVKNKRAFGLDLLAAPEVEGKPFYRSLIIVHKDSGLKTLADLKGKTFAFTDPRSNTGKLYPDYLLRRMQTTPESFFSKYLYSYSHNKSVELVAKRQVDGAAIESLVFMYMLKTGSPYAANIRVIAESMDFGIPPVVVRPQAPEFLKQQLKNSLLGMHREAEGAKILGRMHIDKFVEVPDSNYDSIREIESFVAKGTLASTASQGEARKAIRLAIVPRDNPRIAYEKYQPLIDYLNETTGYAFELALQKTYEDTVEALGRGEIDFALLGPLTYLEARKKYQAHALLRAASEGTGAQYQSVIVVPEKSSIRKVSELKGKRFAFGAPRSTSGNLMPRYMLAGSGIHLKDLSLYKHFSYHDTVIKHVMSGDFDAGAVRKSVAEKFIPAGLRIIETSEALPTGPLVIGPNAKFNQVQVVKDALLTMGRTEKGKLVLARMDSEFRDGFIETKDSDYEKIRVMFNEVPKGCGLGCHPRLQY